MLSFGQFNIPDIEGMEKLIETNIAFLDLK
jgi:hypothetical protein